MDFGRFLGVYESLKMLNKVNLFSIAWSILKKFIK